MTELAEAERKGMERAALLIDNRAAYWRGHAADALAEGDNDTFALSRVVVDHLTLASRAIRRDAERDAP